MAIMPDNIMILEDNFIIEIQNDISLDEDTAAEFAEEVRKKYPECGGAFIAYNNFAEGEDFAGEITVIPMMKEHLLDYFNASAPKE